MRGCNSTASKQEKLFILGGLFPHPSSPLQPRFGAAATRFSNADLGCNSIGGCGSFAVVVGATPSLILLAKSPRFGIVYFRGGSFVGDGKMAIFHASHVGAFSARLFGSSVKLKKEKKKKTLTHLLYLFFFIFLFSNRILIFFFYLFNI